MKKLLYILKQEIYNNAKVLVVFVLLILAIPALAQEEEKEEKVEKPARAAFESAWWFDGQTGKVYNKGTFEFVMQHRFGVISGNKDLFGIYGAANIRLGVSYAPINNLNIGFGYTKSKMIVDFNAKYGILTQTKSNSMPLSVAYYVNMGLEAQDKANYINYADRISYFHQLLLMKRFNSKFSAQLAPSVSHYNVVKWELQSDGNYDRMESDTWAVSAGIRYKFKPQVIVMLGYDQPITQHAINQPKPSINFGIEFATSSHAFQVFATNNNRIQPQENFTFNQNDFSDGGWLIGFNITRLWSF